MQMFEVLRSAYFNNSMIGYSMTGTQMIGFAVFSVFAILLCYDKWNRRGYETLANKLKGPPDYPIIGSSLTGFGDLYEKALNFGELYNYGSFKLWFGSYLGVVITKPEDLQIILNSSQALDKGFIYKMLGKLMGQGLITAPIDKWKIHRRLINTLFKYEHIKEMYFPIYQEKSKILIQNLQKEVGKTQPFDIFDYASDTVLSAICQTTLDYNLDTEADMGFKMNIAKCFELVVSRITKVWLYPDIIYNLYIKLFGHENAYKTVRNLPKHIIDKNKNEYTQEFVKKNTMDKDANDDNKKRFKGLVETLMDTKESGQSLTYEDIMGHVITIVGAGFDSTSLTVSYCLLSLAIHPDIQDKVYDEIYSVLGDSDEPITIEQTNRLTYLKQVIYETLRLFPAAPIMTRQIKDDVTISSGNHTLPKGTFCLICPPITHHNPELYPNPKSFNPENFNAINVAKRHKYSFIGFSGGPRSCIGMKYALLFMTILLTDVLRNFSVHTDMKLSDIKLKLTITLRSTVGFPITIQSRKNSK